MGTPGRRGRPPKPKVAKDTAQPKLTAHFSKVEAESESDAAPSSNNLRESQSGGSTASLTTRKFDTEKVVLLTVPKTTLLDQVPLYAPRNSQSSVEGKIPLEEYSVLELRAFRDQLAAFSGEIRQSRGHFQAEQEHIASLRSRQAFPIFAVTEGELKESLNSAVLPQPSTKLTAAGFPDLTKLEPPSELPSQPGPPRKEPKSAVGPLVPKEEFTLPASADLVEPSKPPATREPVFVDVLPRERPSPLRSSTGRHSARKEPRSQANNPLPTPLDFTPDLMDDGLSEDDSPLKKGRGRGQRKRRKTDSETRGRGRRRKKRKHDRDSSEEDEPEEELSEKPVSGSTPLLSSAKFWSVMEAYVAPFNEVDLFHLQPVDYPADGQVAIPPLGKHYAHEDVQPEEPRGPENEKNDKKALSCGDLTQRLLASLIPCESGRRRTPGHVDHSQSYLPLDAPPTTDYNPFQMESFEDRIRMELMCVGLLDEDMNLARREDDEICSEIRLLQQQLQDRINSNNEKRLTFYQKATHRMKEDRPTVRRFAEYRCVEQIYDRKRTKPKGRRKKGRPRGRPSTNPDTPSTPQTPATPAPATPKSNRPLAGIPFPPQNNPPTKMPRSAFPQFAKPVSDIMEVE